VSHSNIAARAPDCATQRAKDFPLLVGPGPSVQPPMPPSGKTERAMPFSFELATTLRKQVDYKMNTHD